MRPRCLRVATAWIVPSVIGRRKLVWFDRPIADLAVARTTPIAVADRGQALGDRRVDAAVHEPGGLLELVPRPRRARRTDRSAQLGDLEPVEAVEALRDA